MNNYPINETNDDTLRCWRTAKGTWDITWEGSTDLGTVCKVAKGYAALEPYDLLAGSRKSISGKVLFKTKQAAIAGLVAFFNAQHA